EIKNGAPGIPVGPNDHSPRPAFTERGFVHPGIIVAVRNDRLGRCVGALTPDQLEVVRAILPDALGLNSGTAHAPRPALPRAPSRRGALLKLNPGVAEEAGYSWAVLVGPHSYSKAGKFLTTV